MRLFLLLVVAALSSSPLLLAQGVATRDAKPVGAGKRSDRPFNAKLTNIAAAAGLTARLVYGGEDRKKYILEANGVGTALVDYDNDGLLDAFLVNGSTLDPAQRSKEDTSRLYRNLGGGKFEDATAAAGVGRAGWGTGICGGDFDNDGFTDLYVSYWGLNSLYRNNGKGGFTDVAAAAGVAGPAQEWSSGCTFIDFDNDGLLDLFVTSYQEFDLKTAPEPGGKSTCEWKGMPVFCGPRGLPWGAVTLYKNLGGGKFKDVSEAAGVREVKNFYAFTAAALDLDGSPGTDLYVACDSTPNLFFLNDGAGGFVDFAAETGLAFNEHGFEQGGMGIGVGDYDRDGRIDILKTNFAGDYPNLYHNDGDGVFEDHVMRAGLAVNPQFVGWGVELVDLDNDGWQDILQVNGHVYPSLDKQTKVNERYRQPNVVYRNLGGGKFEDVTDLAGPALKETLSSRGAAFGDIDNDGDIDVLVANMGAAPSLLRNDLPKTSHWIRLTLRGTKSNRSAIGSIVTIHAGGSLQSEAVLSQSSYISFSDLRVHFGLGAAAKVDRITVLWPNGEREEFPGAAADRDWLLTQGSGEVREAR